MGINVLDGATPEADCGKIDTVTPRPLMLTVAPIRLLPLIDAATTVPGTPAAALIEVITGGFGEYTKSGKPVEAWPPGFVTTMDTTEGVNSRAGDTVAVRFVELTNVAGRLSPLALTVAPFMKLMPVIAISIAGEPAAILDGDIAVTSGTDWA